MLEKSSAYMGILIALFGQLARTITVFSCLPREPRKTSTPVAPNSGQPAKPSRPAKVDTSQPRQLLMATLKKSAAKALSRSSSAHNLESASASKNAKGVQNADEQSPKRFVSAIFRF